MHAVDSLVVGQRIWITFGEQGMNCVSTRSLYANQNDLGAKDLLDPGSAAGIYHVVQTTAHSLITSIYSTLGVINNVVADEGGLNYIMSLYNISDISNPNEVRAFLASDKSLVPLASEVYHRLQIYFPYCPVFAKVIQNELVISVSTALSPKEAKDRLYKFDDEWWLDVDVDLRSKLCITVEFQ
jgi:hypothetical protein